MSASNYFRNRAIKDRIKIELLEPTSLPKDTYMKRLTNAEDMVEYGVIYREFEHDNMDILYVVEGAGRYGRAIEVIKALLLYSDNAFLYAAVA